jgi:cyclic-di-AMP phosphodiesterase PgpH
VRPEYFVENQIYVDNPHDRLSPSLSKLAITAHVRDGEHLARLYGLPTPVLDIIRQHHGTSVVAYFYHKARESSKEHVDEESYRYEEEKPRSKEAAIVMLADGVEAAVRAMQNPTRRKIQGVIQEIIKQKILDGQLDDSDLTQGDLHRVRDAFDITLRGLVGHRIRYPEKNGETERKSPRVPPSASSAGHGPAHSPAQESQ